MDRNERNGEVTKGTYSDQLTEVVGAGAFDEEGHKNSKFIGSTTIGPYPGEMQAAWDVLRGEAAANYGLEEGWREEEARERMGPLAGQTSARVRNTGVDDEEIGGLCYGKQQAVSRQNKRGSRKTRRGRRKAGNAGEGTNTGEYGRAHGGSGGGNFPAEREASEAQEDSQAKANGEQEASTARGTQENREANARQLASNFLPTMEGTWGKHLRGID